MIHFHKWSGWRGIPVRKWDASSGTGPDARSVNIQFEMGVAQNVLPIREETRICIRCPKTQTRDVKR